MSRDRYLKLDAFGPERIVIVLAIESEQIQVKSPAGDLGIFWYGGMSLFAILMIVLVFRVARRGGSQGLGKRLIELNPTQVPL